MVTNEEIESTMEFVRRKAKNLLARKFLLSLATVVAGFVSVFTGHEMDPEQVAMIIAAVAAFVLGESYVDAKK